MVKIQVLTFSRITQIIGAKQFAIDAENIEDLLSQLITIHGISLQQELFDEQRNFRSTYRILVNGRNINLLAGFQTTFHEGDLIVIMPAIGGG